MDETSENLANFTNRKTFLVKCRKDNVLPRHIFENMNCVITLQTEDHPYQYKVNRMVTNFQRSILNMEIQITFWKLKQITKEITSTKELLTHILSSVTVDNYTQRMDVLFSAISKTVKEKNIKKHDRLDTK